MGIETEDDENQRKIIIDINDLIESLQWYKNYIKGDFLIPEDYSSFTSRNMDIINAISNLTKDIIKYEDCVEKNEFHLTEREKEIKVLQTAVMMRYIGLY